MNLFIFYIVITSYFLKLVIALNPIVIKGHKFFDSITKDQFFIKGVAYQPRTNVNTLDPLADPKACSRDAVLMSKLGLNVIRVYEIDPKNDHSQCMKSFSDAGIYLVLDLFAPHKSINREKPEYSLDLYNSFKAAVDTFHDYDNMLGYIVGNEVTNDQTNTLASAYVKAAIRDMKGYIKSNKTKSLPVGYASNDDQYIRDSIKDYFACGTNEERVDFYGLNIYEWCGNSSYQSSGYAERTKELLDYNVPVILSEYGCNLNSPRPFTEVGAIYSKPMTDVFSGGIAYEWTQENNNYGLIQLGSGGNAKLLQDYTNLQKELAKVKKSTNNTILKMDDFKDEQRSNPSCPQNQYWKANEKLPPTPSETTCNCMMKSIVCGLSTNNKAELSAQSTDDLMNASAKNSTLVKQFDLMCSLTTCQDIGGDAEKGEYGAFSYCPPIDKLSWLYHSYFVTKKGSTCDFEGNAVELSPKKEDVEDCASLGADLNAQNLSINPKNNDDENDKNKKKKNGSFNENDPFNTGTSLGISQYCYDFNILLILSSILFLIT